jgi:glyoxylase-like metal-dependent hydrolase (beta-lactamase superfamily II)
MLALVLAALPSPLAAQSPRDIVARAVQAMGGEAAVRGLRNKTVDFYSSNFQLGQEETPLSPPRATVSYGRIITDYAGNRQLATQEARVLSGAVNRQRRIVVNGIGMTELNGTSNVDAPAGVNAALRGMALQPERFLLTALDNSAGLSALKPRVFRGETMTGLRYAIAPDTMDLWFDRPTGMLVVSEQVTDDAVLGDRRTLTWYTRWQDATGVQLPRQVDTEVNGRILSHNVVGSLSINQSLDETQFAIPDSLASRAQRGPAPAPVMTVTLAELAPGIWRAEGGTHHSLIIDQGATLLVLEGPLSAARTSAVLDSLKSRFPGKRVSAVVATHHHWDHSGGLRAYLARGIPVIAHPRNQAFVRAVGSARKTVAPDALSRGGAAPAPRSTGDSLSIGTGPSRVILFPIASDHVEGILAAWVPWAGIVFTSDILSPQANQALPAVGSRELVVFAKERGISPSKYAGGHGVVVDWSAVEAAAR